MTKRENLEVNVIVTLMFVILVLVFAGLCWLMASGGDEITEYDGRCIRDSGIAYFSGEAVYCQNGMVYRPYGAR